MAIISGQVVFDRDRSATISSGDSGLSNIPVVLQNVNTGARLTVLTDAAGYYTFLNVPDGSYRIVESYGTSGGLPTPGDFSAAESGSVPQGVNPPISAVENPPSGATNLDSLTPDTLLVTVSGADLTDQNFLNGPVIYTPIQAILDPCAAISGDNLISAAENGAFGSFPQGTPANTGASTEPYPGVTPDFTYVLPDPSDYTPTGEEYTVQNIMNDAYSAAVGSWWRIADHTVGNETGRMMIVNGYNPGSVFFRNMVQVQPDTNYLFTAWILNLFRVTGYPDPELGVQILDQNGGVLYRATLGTLIPINVDMPEWKEIGSVINSRGNTSLTLEFLSEGPEVVGNDYAIDDVSFNEIQTPVFTPVKTVDRQSVIVGETVRYTVTLTSSCQSPLTNVFFQDAVPDGLSFVPGSVEINGAASTEADPGAGFALPDIPGGETVTVSFSAAVTAVPAPNPALNSASFRYEYTPVEGGIPGEFNVVSNEVPVSVDESADVSVVKTSNPSPVEPGGILTYTVTVTNSGPSAANNVVLFDEIPPELSDAKFSVDGGLTWNSWSNPYPLGQFDVGEAITVLIRGNVVSSGCGIISNTATAASATPDPNPNNNTSTANTPVLPSGGEADLSIQKTACPNPVRRCQNVTFRITVINAGPDTAEQVVITDALPSELIRPVYSVDNCQTWSNWTGSYRIDSLAAGASVTILIAAIVNTCCCGCFIRNTASVSSDTNDPNPSNNTVSIAVNVVDNPYLNT